MTNRYAFASKVLKLIISIAFYSFLRLRNGFARLIGKNVPAACIVLYYHSVPASHRKAFARQLEVLRRLTTPVNIENLPPLADEKRYSAITFDDGFEDALQVAVPELTMRNLPACFFVTAGFLGQTASWWPDVSPEHSGRIATPEQLQKLPLELISVGAHTMTHPRLSQLDELQAKEELMECRRKLEETIGQKVRLFSFPYGDFNQNLVRWCRDAGYSRVFTTQHQWAFRDSMEFVVGRVKVDPDDWALEFRLKLLGAYLWAPSASALKRKVLKVSTALGFRFAPPVP